MDNIKDSLIEHIDYDINFRKDLISIALQKRLEKMMWDMLSFSHTSLYINTTGLIKDANAGATIFDMCLRLYWL